MKSILIRVLAVAILFSCSPSSSESLSAANEKKVQEFFTHFNNHDWAKMAGMYAETADFKDPSLGQGIVKQSRQQIIDKYSQLQQSFADLHDSIVAVYPSGDKNIIVEFVSTGTAPDSSKFELPVCTVFTFENGFITKDFTYYDNFEEPETENKP